MTMIGGISGGAPERPKKDFVPETEAQKKALKISEASAGCLAVPFFLGQSLGSPAYQKLKNRVLGQEKIFRTKETLERLLKSFGLHPMEPKYFTSDLKKIEHCANYIAALFVGALVRENSEELKAKVAKLYLESCEFTKDSAKSYYLDSLTINLILVLRIFEGTTGIEFKSMEEMLKGVYDPVDRLCAVVDELAEKIFKTDENDESLCRVFDIDFLLKKIETGGRSLEVYLENSEERGAREDILIDLASTLAMKDAYAFLGEMGFYVLEVDHSSLNATNSTFCKMAALIIALKKIASDILDEEEHLMEQMNDEEYCKEQDKEIDVILPDDFLPNINSRKLIGLNLEAISRSLDPYREELEEFISVFDLRNNEEYSATTVLERIIENGEIVKYMDLIRNVLIAIKIEAPNRVFTHLNGYPGKDQPKFDSEVLCFGETLRGLRVSARQLKKAGELLRRLDEKREAHRKSLGASG